MAGFPKKKSEELEEELQSRTSGAGARNEGNALYRTSKPLGHQKPDFSTGLKRCRQYADGRWLARLPLRRAGPHGGGFEVGFFGLQS